MPRRSIRCRGRVFLRPPSGAAAGRAQPALGLDGRKSGPLALPFPGEDVAAALRRRGSEQRAAGRALPAVRHFFWSGAVLRPWFFTSRETRITAFPRAPAGEWRETRASFPPPARGSFLLGGVEAPLAPVSALDLGAGRQQHHPLASSAASLGGRRNLDAARRYGVGSVCRGGVGGSKRVRPAFVQRGKVARRRHPYTEAGSAALAKSDRCRPQRL